MRIFVNYLGALLFVTLIVACSLYPQTAVGASEKNNETESAILIKGSGVYHRTISTSNTLAQQFFDQGLRYAWGFYFPESIAS